MKRVLVIKLSALGDVVLALAPMARIRAAHPEAEITVLTTRPYAAFLAASPFVDQVEDDGRPRTVLGMVRLVRRLRRARYDRVYDLQTSDRSSLLHFLLGPRPPQWSGIARGASHPHRNPGRDHMHALEAKADQLKDAGIWPDAPTTPGSAPPPDLSWILKDVSPDLRPAHFGLKGPFALLIPGGSAHRPEKRWPAPYWARLGALLKARGLEPVVIGGPDETGLAALVGGRDLVGKTDFRQVAALAARAAVTIGNDTGPTHLAAAAGSPTLALFSAASDPAKSAPRGANVTVLRKPQLGDLTVEEVEGVVETLIRRT